MIDTNCGDRGGGGGVNHESSNAMGYNTTFFLCFLTFILTLAEKIFLTPPLSPTHISCSDLLHEPSTTVIVSQPDLSAAF